MIHKYKLNGFNIVLDVNSGGVHIVDELTYDLLENIKPPFEPECRQDIIDKLAKVYPVEEIKTCYAEIVELYNEKILFSADAFGKFGAIDEENPLYDWACEARRYYFGIVGKFGANIQAVLKKVSALEINQICPLHGPVLRENLCEYISLYDTWSKYEAESEGVVVAYDSIYVKIYW